MDEAPPGWEGFFQQHTGYSVICHARQVWYCRRMKVYEGMRTGEGCIVTVNGQPLDPRTDLCNHSPTGFEWAYGGSGPAQLSLALLADALGDDELAQDHYQKFKRKIVAGFEAEGWILTQAEIRSWIGSLLGGDGKPSDQRPE